MKVQVFDGTALDSAQRAGGRPYHEFLHVPALSAGIYRLAAGARDAQSPHAEDELYHVIAGRAVFVGGGERRPVGPGAMIFVAAHEAHRFEDIAEELVVLVVFAPAESGA